MPYLVCLLVLTALWISPASARPDMAPLGKNIADTGSAWYHFTTREFTSADGQRHYLVWTGTPRKHVPGGYPVLYMLDGNAVMDRLDDALLGRLSQGTPPVIVALGYRGNLPFNRQGRSLDYTPPGSSNPARRGDGIVYGGSRSFLTLLTSRIMPVAEQGIDVNPARRGLWGHSYGGLLVLDAWLNAGNFSRGFSRYYSASPSLWLTGYRLVDQLSGQPAANPAARLWLMEGDAEDARGLAPRGEGRSHRQVISQLRAAGVPVQAVAYPGLSHGAMFPASAVDALLDIAGVAPLPARQ